MPELLLFLPIASVLTSAILLVGILAAGAIGSVTAFLYWRAKSLEAEGGAPAPNIASSAAPVPVATEVKAIGEQIEQAMADQRLQGETQRQILSQKLDSVRQAVDTQRNQVDGLRNEFRHEVRRRDAEIDEIKHQIATISTGGALPAAPLTALPAADAFTPPIAPEEAPFASSAPDAPSFDPTVFEEAEALSVDVPHVDEAEPPSLDAFAFEGVVFESPINHEGDSAPMDESSMPPAMSFEEPSFEEATFEDATFEDVSFDTVPFEDDTEAPSDAPAPTAEPDDAFAEVSFDDAPMLTISLDDLAPPTEAPELHEADAEPSEADADTFAEFSFAPPTSAPPPEPAPELVAEQDDVSDDPFSAHSIEPEEEPTEPTFAPVDFASATPFSEPAEATSIFEPWSQVAHPASSATSEAPSAAAPEAPAYTPDSDVEPEPVTAQASAFFGLSGTVEPETVQPNGVSSFEPMPPLSALDPVEPVAPPKPTETAIEEAPAPADAEPVWVARPDRPEVSIDRVASDPEPMSDFGLPIAEPVIAPMDDFFPPMGQMPEEPPVLDTAPPMASTPDETEETQSEAEVAAAPAEEPTAEMETPMETSDEPTPAPIPEGAENLTVISSIDEDTQRLLYNEGVFTLDEIARWGRGEARRISTTVQVPEDTIMNQWVFEAQAALFSQFAQQASR